MVENLEKNKKNIKNSKSVTVHPREFGAFKDIEIFITDSFTPLMFVLIMDWGGQYCFY